MGEGGRRMGEGGDCLEMREWEREESGDEGMGEGGGRRLEMREWRREKIVWR